MALTAFGFDAIFSIRSRVNTRSDAPLGWIGGSLPLTPDGPDGRARILNEPGVVSVRLFDRISMELVATTRSSPDGMWRVEGLPMDRPLMVIGLDVHGQVNGAIQDWVYPAPMEP